LLTRLIETVGIEGGVIKLTIPDNGDPIGFEALERYEDQNPASSED
jgi:hypothetical protein